MRQYRNHEIEKCVAQILSQEVITQQQTLLKRLQKEGVCVAQATLSRCLHRMGVAKIRGVYRLAPQKQTVLEAVLHLQQVPPNLLVMHTLPGHANSVAAYLDRARQKAAQQKPLFGNIAATLAGDDTVLVVVHQRHLQQVHQSLAQLCKEAGPGPSRP
ncbi:MAG: hypothetical protein AAF320_05400 [Myxococcota bacterium]